VRILLIVTGSQGLLGKALVEFAKQKNIDVIGISRPNYQNTKEILYEKRQFNSCQLGLEKNKLLKDQNIKKIIINCAWSGESGLTDGGLKKQLDNLIFLEDLFSFSLDYDIHDIINIGSFDELIVERALEVGETSFSTNFNHLEYGIAKLACRDILKFRCYMHKINLVHAKLSIMVDPYLRKINFIEKNLKSILLGGEYDIPDSEELYNISSSDYIAKQLIQFIEKTKIPKDLILGSGLCLNLKDYFESIRMVLDGENVTGYHSNGNYLHETDFNNNANVTIDKHSMILELIKGFKI
tara:strand:- start:153 stop:1043 length:891 start_codon:yes stop_codon:yes gene_type:complete